MLFPFSLTGQLLCNLEDSVCDTNLWGHTQPSSKLQAELGAPRAPCIYLYNSMYHIMLISTLGKYSVLIIYKLENPVNVKNSFQ